MAQTNQRESGMKPLGHKHPEHEYIVARQEKYIEVWRRGSPDEIMQFMDPKELNYSHYGMEKQDLTHSKVKDLFARNKTDLHDLEIKTRSLHGHKHFTAWEWVVTCRHGIGSNGDVLKKEHAPPKRMMGCTLMWWNNDDKIIRQHEYAQVRDT
ncbi:MAG: hypothetical protein Q9222_003748 [Ikaeria aurantiellina]